MAYSNDLFTRINERFGHLSKGQKILASYLSENIEECSFLTASMLGQRVGISESTVVRFAKEMGYSGYPEFQKALEELVLSRLNKTPSKLDFGKIDKSSLLSSVLLEDAIHITNTIENIDEQTFSMAVDMIDKAENIYIIGLRNSYALAEYLYFNLNLAYSRVHLLNTNSNAEILEQMLRIGKKDLIIGISFPRYSMRTLKALEYAKSRNAKVISITDSPHSPLNLYSSCNLICESAFSSITESLVAPMSLINALIAAVSVKNEKQIIKNLSDLEAIWDDYQVSGSDEIDYLSDTLKMHYHLPEKNNE